MSLFLKRCFVAVLVVFALFVRPPAILGQSLTITTFAGQAAGGSDDGTGSAARFDTPTGVATDGSGNIYIVDANNTIRVGRVALADVATIDLSTGSPGVTRLLDTSPQTARSWQWSVIRRPVDSVADFSSATVRNPTFTPGCAGTLHVPAHRDRSSGHEHHYGGLYEPRSGRAATGGPPLIG
jgi:hypothetical protein